MNVEEVAAALSRNFLGFKGSETELLRGLFTYSDPGSLRDCPSNPRAFRTALKAIAGELVVHGVSVTIFDTGMVHVKSASDAQKEASAEAALRSSFFSALPESVVLRSEFGNTEQGFQRFAAFRRGLNMGHIKQPRRGTNVLAAEGRGEKHAEVDRSLPIEEQCRQRWPLEPETRSAFGNNYSRFESYERANARGVVRKFAPGA
jgi:hypothetical protein